jgi:hypothetical protein
MKSAVVIPFPARARPHFVNRHASRMAALSASASENHLAHQVEIQRAALTRKGADPLLIEREMKMLEGAIRAALWRHVLTPGGAA